MSESDKNTRQLPSWSQGFLEYSAKFPSPEIYRKWAAYSTLAGVMERRCYVMTAIKPIYPNMFIMLVAPPAVGKSIAISAARELVTSCGMFRVAPNSITRAAFIDFVESEGKTNINLEDNTMTESHPVLIMSDEFGVLVTSHETEWLNTLNDMYDCPSVFDSATRIKGEIFIANPSVNMIVGTQPAYLGDKLPETAWGMGFMSRNIMIYAGAPIKTNIFASHGADLALHDAMVHDLRVLGDKDFTGEFLLTEEAAEYFNEQYLKDFPPIPNHPKLQGYSARRMTHILKLCMILSIDSSNDLVITAEHVHMAISEFHLIEEIMPQIFMEISGQGHDSAIREAYAWMIHEYMKKKEAIPERNLFNFLLPRLPNREVRFALDNMIRGGLIEQEGGLNLPENQRKFVPIVR